MKKVAMGRHSVERVKQTRSMASRFLLRVRLFATTGSPRMGTMERTLFGDPSLNLFGGVG